MSEKFSYLGNWLDMVGGGLGPMSKIIRMLYLLKLGKTRAEIADLFGVTRRTVYNWEKLARDVFHAKTTMELICWCCGKGLFDRFDARRPREEW